MDLFRRQAPDPFGHVRKNCEARGRTWILSGQSRACCQLHHFAVQRIEDREASVEDREQVRAIIYSRSLHLYLLPPSGAAGFEPAASCSQGRRASRTALHPETGSGGRIRIGGFLLNRQALLPTELRQNDLLTSDFRSLISVIKFGARDET
jgi:hypothetical protein